MVEELVKLLSVLDGLTWMAMAVVAMIFAYKVAIVGSIYGVVRYAVGKVHDMVVSKAQHAASLVGVEKEWQRVIRRAFAANTSGTLSFHRAEIEAVADLFECIHRNYCHHNDYTGARQSHVHRSDIHKVIADLDRLGSDRAKAKREENRE